jgi:hypothetical protein
MKGIFLLPLLLTVTVTLAGEQFVSPDQSSTLVVDRSGNHDLIELKSDNTVHHLFHENFEHLLRPKLAEAYNASLEKTGKVASPTLESAKWLSPDKVEIKGKSNVTIDNKAGNAFAFTALVSKSGSVQDLTVEPAPMSRTRSRPSEKTPTPVEPAPMSTTRGRPSANTPTPGPNPQ